MCFKLLQLSRRTTTDYSRYENAGMTLMAENGILELETYMSAFSIKQTVCFPAKADVWLEILNMTSAKRSLKITTASIS
jgi:hypothetical protein